MTIFILGGKEVKRASGLIKHYSLEIKSNVFISTMDSKIRGLLIERLKKFGQSALIRPLYMGIKVSLRFRLAMVVQSDPYIWGLK